MKILALDLSKNTGWAVGTIDGPPVYGHFTLPKTGKDLGAYAVAFTNHLCPLLDEHVPDHVCFEAPILRQGKTPIETARKLYGLAYHTEFICKIRGLPCSETLQQSARSSFGCKWPKRGLSDRERRKFWKDQMMRLCQFRGWEPKTDDEADALCVWADACERFAPRKLRLAFA